MTLSKPSSKTALSDAANTAERQQSSITSDSIKVGSDAVGEALKAYFDGIVSEPVPDRFLDLLSSLETI